MTPAGRPIGVVVMAYGTPAGPDDIEAFYTDVRRGRRPSEEQLADLSGRYQAIGGVSPLAERSRAQVAGIQRALDDIAPGGFRAAFGAKHSSPRIEDAVHDLAADGVNAAVGIVLAPHFSELSVGEYRDRLEASGVAEGVATSLVESWHDMPALIDLLAERVRSALASLAGAPGDRVAAAGGRAEVLFTAHSLPTRILESGDPYPGQLLETAAAVAARAGVEHWRTAWQSAGRTAEEWLGPDLLDVIRSLPGQGVEQVVVCPAGFTSDHLEVLYDIDIEARRVAEECGLGFARTESLNDDPRLCQGLAGLVAAAAGPLASDEHEKPAFGGRGG